MIYLPDRKAVWVFYYPYSREATQTPALGAWLAFADTFVDGEPETDPGIAPPPNLQQPKRGFGKVWRDNPNVRDAVVTDYAIGAFDANGQFAPQTFFHTLTGPNGKLIHVDEAAATWTMP